MLRTQPEPAVTGGLLGPPHASAPSVGTARGSTPPAANSPAAERANPLGSYLRARRERTTPEQAGIVTSGRRRVPGLRREELALHAGISADYYLRLERGRDRHPSPQVLDALARVLRLNRDETAHLRRLATAGTAAPTPTPTASPQAASPHAASDGSRDPRSAEIPPSTRALLHALPHPAFIEDRFFTIVDANQAARELNPRLVPGRNQLRDVLVDDAERAMHPEGDLTAACLIASLRHTVGAEVRDPRYIRLTDELHERSERFREIWSQHDVRAQRGATVTLMHPAHGVQHFDREQLGLNTAAGLKLVVYSPAERGEPGEPGGSVVTP